MGYRTTFISNDTRVEWQLWFREKYAKSIRFPNTTGPISSVNEGKFYNGAAGAFGELLDDLMRVDGVGSFRREVMYRAVRLGG